MGVTASRLLSPLAAKAYAGLSVVLALACALLWFRGNAWEAAAGRWQETAGQWKQAHEAQAAAVRATAASAEAKARNAKAEQEERDERNRREHDNAYSTSLADGRRRADAYARANRVRQPGAAGGDPAAAGGADLPRPAFGAEVDHGAGDPAELVAITRADFDLCTVNSLRLLNAHEWNADGRRSGDLQTEEE